MVHKFLSKFDKKRLGIAFKLTILVLCLVLIVNVVDITYSRYQSSANVNVQSNIALFLIDQGTTSGTITLEGLEPSNNAYKYVVNVRNYKQGVRTNVDLDYHIKFETTTNVPFTVEVYRNQDNEDPGATNIVTTPTSRRDGDVYYKVYDTVGNHRFHYNTNEQDYYTIVVKFATSYKNYPELYQGKVDLLSVIITAEQVV